MFRSSRSRVRVSIRIFFFWFWHTILGYIRVSTLWAKELDRNPIVNRKPPIFKQSLHLVHSTTWRPVLLLPRVPPGAVGYLRYTSTFYTFHRSPTAVFLRLRVTAFFAPRPSRIPSQKSLQRREPRTCSASPGNQNFHEMNFMSSRTAISGYSRGYSRL